MGRTLILAEDVLTGEKHAVANGIPRSYVVTPRSTDRARGCRFDDFVTVGSPVFSVDGWAEVTPAFLHAGSDVLDRLQFQMLRILPPPIQLEREDVQGG